ncbi:juvenile hormone esterase [Diabrotica virgifera virgifera]|uniref:Carboxylic ester hydrolase n=1 Tax=Diabrotica virgifera virgifera TaxID=50390 RepID=A0ABM5IQZ3_DIAVI|nr:juvenile hormone esterase [Diabrotica virgifera virgifera]
MRLFYFLGLFSLLFCINAEIIVTTPNGKIRGRQEYSQRGISFFAFQQIPFAKPPVGSLRFKAPIPAEPWSGVLNATKNDRVCFQQKYPFPGTEIPQKEDCLYLNVYTPVEPSRNVSLPVMVYIYGGGFVTGANHIDFHGPHYLMEHGVIIVSANYRVGPFGFLSTGDTVIPGNNGLKDQLLALKWVQENIEHFGGDKTKVTIFGQSAGGASVTYQLMSEKSKGLFRAAISQSGSILSPWTFQRDHRQIAYDLSIALDPAFSPNATSQEVLELLQNKTAKELNDAAVALMSETYYNNQIVQGFQFTPVIEPNHDDAFITKKMYDALIDGEMQRVPLIIGICSEEMIWNALDLDVFKQTASSLDSNLSLLVNNNMHISNVTKKQEIGDDIRKVYTNGSFINGIGHAVQFYSDTSFGRPIIHHAKKQSQFSDVYFYQFSYYGAIPGPRPYIEGAYKVGHSDDEMYVWAFLNNSNLNSYPKPDVLTSDRYRTLFTNFAKTLNPVSDKTELLGIKSWPKVTPNEFQYLDINETLTIKKDIKKHVYDGWVNVYENEAVKPYDTF